MPNKNTSCVVQVTIPEEEMYFIMMDYPGTPRELFHAIQALGVRVEYTAVFAVTHEYDAFGSEMKRTSEMMDQHLGPSEGE